SAISRPVPKRSRSARARSSAWCGPTRSSFRSSRALHREKPRLRCPEQKSTERTRGDRRRMQHVTSRQNPRLKEAVRLIASSRDRRKAGKCVLEGEHLVAVYAQRHGAPESIVVTDEALARPGVRALAARHEDRVLVVTPRLLSELAILPAGVGMLAV